MPTLRPAWKPDKDKWLKGVEAVGVDRYREGVQNPRANFKDAALANKEGWKKGVQEAITNGTYEKGLAKVNVDEAIQTAATLGADSLAAGARARQDKFQRNVDAIAGKMSAVTEAVRKMPATTAQEREARMIAQVRGARDAASK